MAQKPTCVEMKKMIKELEELNDSYKQNEEILLKEISINKTLFDASPTFFCSINDQGKTLMMNQAMLNALGYSEEEVLGTSYLSTFVPNQDHELTVKNFEERIRSLQPTIHENHVLTKNGRKILIEWHGRSIMKSDGTLDFFFGVGIDITERRKAERKLQEAFAEIKRLKNRLEAENIYLRQEIKQRHNKIVGQSEAIKSLLGQIELITNIDSTVLILGETGTGKELVAESLHYSGPRAKRPLIKVNCSALSETILESELFGHVRGAFSGAIKDKIGRIQAAERGSIFLDEIGEISPQIQVKLLRFLDCKEYERVGESKTYKANVRIIVATNNDLKEKIRQRTFRKDLYYRLNMMTLHLPPLRKRKSDIPLLVAHFLRHYAILFKRDVGSVSGGTMKILLEYSWPGNVRELKHTIEHACLLCRGKTIQRKHLQNELRTEYPSIESRDKDLETESQRIQEALIKSSWKKARAARLLGIHRSTLYRKMDRYRISER